MALTLIASLGLLALIIIIIGVSDAINTGATRCKKCGRPVKPYLTFRHIWWWCIHCGSVDVLESQKRRTK